MPYIRQDRRKAIDAQLTPFLKGHTCHDAGELNYVITTYRIQATGCRAGSQLNRDLERVFLGYIDRHGRRYVTFNDIIGALTCAAKEINRRRPLIGNLPLYAIADGLYSGVVATYEDAKIKENGDVFA